MRDYLRAVSLLVGTQIGAGVLGLPYAIKGLGFFWGSIAIALAGILMGLTALFLLDAIYRTNPRFHLFELFEHHLGKKGSILFTILLLFSVYGALSAYTYGISQSIEHLLGVDPTISGVIVWGILSFVVLMGLRLSSTVEFGAVTLMGLLFLLTVLWLIPYIIPYHVPLNERYKELFTAISISVFAFYMHLVIPEAVSILKDRKLVAKAIMHSFVITTLLYILFSLAVIGTLREETPEISIFGLVNVLGPFYAPLAYIIPLLTMLTSFIGVALGAVDMVTEYIRRRFAGWIIVVLPPLLMFLLHLRFYESLLFGSLGLLFVGGILPSYLMIKIHGRKHPLPYLTLLIFLLILISQLLPA